MREGNFNRVEKGLGVSSQELVSGEVIAHAKSAKFAKSDVESQKSGTDFFNAEKQSSREAENRLALAAKNAKSAKDWSMVRLGDVCEVVAGQSPEGKYYTTDSSFVEFHQGCKAFGSKYLQSSNVYTKEITKVAGEGYIVMSVRAPVGTVNITQREICIGRGLCTFVLSNKIFREFLYFYLLASKKYLNDVAGAGTVFSSISRKQLMDIQIPLPPLSVQKEIVERLEKELGEVDKVAAEFKRMAELADNEFKAELDETFGGLENGELGTGNGNDSNRVERVERVEKGLGVSSQELGLAAKGAEDWPMVRLGDVCAIKGGFAFKSKEYTDSGLQVVRISDLSGNEISKKDAFYYPETFGLEKFVINEECILICLTGSIGKMAIVNDGVKRYLNQRVGLLTCSCEILIKYVWHYLHSERVLDIWDKAKTSVNGNLRNSDITDLKIPLPPIEVQKEIVDKLDAAKERCEKLKAAAERGLRAAENLRKAILSEAF